ncbi:actin-related protein 8-like isoform X1 [Homalodisca vitripennis]|nr:actin-related protein 8-like isoform X1 [Homalodisca vitripennis]XP_046665667.1 actin-related protein 8-like isoform X1 [Homalodisca vitripennis]KAG8332324.1 Actin- protein 8 [Homalodisca vitripennis]
MMHLQGNLGNLEQIQKQTIIVIHPGSLYVRIGRASDSNPHTELHAIARKRYPGGLKHCDSMLPPLAHMTGEVLQEMEDCRLQVSHTLQSCLQSDGRRRYATPPQQIAAFNRRVQPEVISSSGGEWTKQEGNCVIGNEVLHINPALDYNVHFPIRRGELNVHSGVGGSLTSVLTDLQDIWSWVIQFKLDIPISDLKHYRAVLIVPDIYNRHYLRELMTLLLNKMGFGSCFLLQDHVAATFGAGLPCACVIDCGHQKTSVSCVEDGISHPATRVRIGYGGGDITQSLHWLLQKCAFPYKGCDPGNNSLDALLLQNLKHDSCHINLDVCGCTERQFLIQQPKLTCISYTIQMADECLIAPLGFFSPELLGVTGVKSVVTQERSTGDPQDPHDADYLRETSRRGAKEVLEPTPEGVNPESGGGGGGEEDIVVDAMLESQPGVAPQPTEFVLSPGQLLGLDQAILQSIDRCGSDDLKRKMYSSILIVGGGMKFQGISTWLQNRIALQIPYMLRSEQMDIVTAPKEMDPQITSWIGASILCCLESAQELWIHPKEWEKYSVKILRERAPFMW